MFNVLNVLLEFIVVFGVECVCICCNLVLYIDDDYFGVVNDLL